MTRARRIPYLAAATAVAFAVGGCTSATHGPSASQSLAPSSSVATAATSTTARPPESQVASTAASAVLRKYYDVRNQLRTDPSKPLSLLTTIAISKELSTEKNLFTTERKHGVHQVGDTKVTKLEVQSVNLDNSDPSAGKVPTVTIDVCYDVKGVDIVDKDGKSIVKPGRPNTGWIEYLVSNYQWAKDPEGGWRVASSQDIERTPCAAS